MHMVESDAFFNLCNFLFVHSLFNGLGQLSDVGPLFFKSFRCYINRLSFMRVPFYSVILDLLGWGFNGTREAFKCRFNHRQVFQML